jgi:competence protein ComEA
MEENDMAQEKNIAHGSRINLNTASREELAQVPGSSEQCADDIIRLREERGGLKSVEEIDDLKGFGEAAVRHFKEHGTV